MLPDPSPGGVGVYSEGGDWFWLVCCGISVGGGSVVGCRTCHGTVTEEIIGCLIGCVVKLTIMMIILMIW